MLDLYPQQVRMIVLLIISRCRERKSSACTHAEWSDLKPILNRTVCDSGFLSLSRRDIERNERAVSAKYQR